MNFKVILATATAAAAILVGGAAAANPSNVGEPTGTVIDDRNGALINHVGWATVTASFVAGAVSTDVGFAFRDDPAFIHFDNASVNTGGGANLLTNGDFSTGDLTGWTYQNPQAATFSGVVTGGNGNPAPSWSDGSVQAYDTLDQVIATVIGQTYTVSYQYFEDSGNTTFSALSTNGDVTDTGGNGINIVTYAGNARPVLQGGVPEPATWAMMLIGFGGIGAMVRNRRRQASFA